MPAGQEDARVDEPAAPPDPTTLNAALVDKLVRGGLIRSPRVEAAFRAVERHHFLPGVALEEVYRDRAIPTRRLGGRVVSSSSQPAIMAIMLEQLAVEPGMRVLEVGAGTGYNAALMASLVGPEGRVTTVDVDPEVVAAARQHLAAAGVDAVRVVLGDGRLGHPEGAPYDRVILTVSAAEVEPAWRAQLAPGGRLVMPLLLLDDLQKVVAFEERDGALESVSVASGGFMSLRSLGFPPGNPELRVRVEPRQPGDDAPPWRAVFTRPTTRIVFEYAATDLERCRALLNARAASVLDRAQAEARALNHSWLGAVHLLIALLREADGRAAARLRERGVALEAVLAETAAAGFDAGGAAPADADVIWAPPARRALALAVEAAREAGHQRVGTEHLLVGLARVDQAFSTLVFERLGVDLPALRSLDLTDASQLD